MAERQRLPNRRESELIDFRCSGFRYTAGISRFGDGRLAEIFITNSKAGSDADTAARDSAVVASIALQYGVPLEVLRRALMRDAQGLPSGPLGTALDLIAQDPEPLADTANVRHPSPPSSGSGGQLLELVPSDG